MAKTGTIGMARALQRLLTLRLTETPLAFSIMVNHHTESNNYRKQNIENVVNTLASFEAGR